MSEQVFPGGVDVPQVELQMEGDELVSVVHQMLNLWEAAKKAEEYGPTNPLFGDFVRAHEIMREEIKWANLSINVTDIGVLMDAFAIAVRARLPVYKNEADKKGTVSI